MKKRHIYTILLVLVLAFALTGCIPGDGKHTTDDPAGFFFGIWHGWVAPISLVIGIFNSDISVFEVNNTGWWYNFGFYIAIISGFGGISLFRKKNKNNNDN